MSNNTSTYVTFSALDYKGIDSLSSYALSVTPLKFIPDIPQTKNTGLLWEFGDGTYSYSFSAEKYYKFPGRYNVRLIQYDCNDNATISSDEKTILIYDYYPLTFSIYPAFNYIKCGQISGPIEFKCQYPWYQPKLDIFYSVDDSNDLNFWAISAEKFSHLESYNSFFKKTYNYNLSSYQYEEIDRIVTNVSPVYLKVKDGTIIHTVSNVSGACYAGMEGWTSTYFKSDEVSPKITIDLKYDKTNFKNLYEDDFNYLNNLGLTYETAVSSNTPSDLSITSNGLDGEGYPITSFDIEKIKFYKTKIPFVVKIKDAYNFSVKNFDSMPLSALSIELYYSNEIDNSILIDPSGEVLTDELENVVMVDGAEAYEEVHIISPFQYTLSSLNYTLSSLNSHGGSFRGYLYFDELSSVLTGVKIKVSGSFMNDQNETYSLSGESSSFNLFSPKYYDIFKKNEDYNAEETLKDLRFQEVLIDKNILFEDFLGTILGDENSDYNDIGIKTYEKIANFIQNTEDLDTSELEFLNSMTEMINYNDFFEERYEYPEKVKRLVNLLSIDKSKLLGYKNQFDENLDSRDHLSHDTYGKNTGDRIDPFSYVVRITTPIVAKEKFSEEYVMLNTYQPYEVVGTTTYPLSNYSSDWGWPLVLPTSFSFDDIENYYEFYEYVDGKDNTIVDGVVDFDNDKTTIDYDISQDTLNKSYGVKEHMFVDTLYRTLSLIEV